MIVAIAQLVSIAGDIHANLSAHQQMVAKAAAQGATLVVFSELSLTGYEPTLARALAISPHDARLDALQMQADALVVSIAVGVPIRHDSRVYIGMLIFCPYLPRQVYTKQYLHPDEQPFFAGGMVSELFWLNGQGVAPAICYEIFVSQHAQAAHEHQASLYLASVAKSEVGVAKAYQRLAEVAQSYQMVVVMANALGVNDNFVSAGQSGVWNGRGELVAQLGSQAPGLLLYDTKADTAQVVGTDE
jgi:predicted amidohydrolase